MATGKVKSKNPRGFGFIAVEGSADVFFHSSACNGQFESIGENQMVTFDLEQGEKGPKAVNVVVGGGADMREPSDGEAEAPHSDINIAA